MEKIRLMCRVKRMFHLQESARKTEHESCSMAQVRVHTRLPALGNGTRLKGGSGGVVPSSSLPLSNLGCNVLCKCWHCILNTGDL